MSEQFHQLANVEEVDAATSFTIRRAREIVVAAESNSDYSVIQLLRCTKAASGLIEIVVVDVECDGVPSRNEVGIQYCERLALCVPENSGALVDVLTLRKSFPALIHQNYGSRAGPSSLCLYFEHQSAVARTWTPQRFLRRIVWWLEMSAKRELHPADQPVEHLFFSSKFELVLPWNISDLRRDVSLRMMVERGPERPDGGCTFFLRALPKAKPVSGASAAPVELTLPPIVQGIIERDPTTLGELADLLSHRGVEFLPILKQALREGVDSDGLPVGAPETFVVVILHVPMLREAGGTPHRTARRAFLLQMGARQLGVSTGALYVHEKRYFAELEGSVLSREPATEWMKEQVLPMEVLQFQDREGAQRQSSVVDEGPAATLIGAGSLGSALLNLWSRAGWGQWSVIDKDHIKPHNLVRHTVFALHVGDSKSNAVAELAAAATDGAAQVVPVVGDACSLAPNLRDVLDASGLVVDATAALDYPRLASSHESLPRHASVFVTPNGGGAILLLEDAARTIRLRSLEAQYYRALIRKDWGSSHLDGNLSTYWSGASCRDISVAMPYSRIVAHASTLAEQLMAHANLQHAAIRVWERDIDSGSVVLHQVDPNPELSLSFGELTVYLDEGLVSHLRAFREAALPKETGGILVGYHDFNINAIVIVDALAAPVDSLATTGFFERGTSGLTGAVEEASRRTAGIVGYIGEWHSHPRGHSAQPSSDDLVQLVELAVGMHDDGLPALQLIVGEKDVRVLHGAVNG